MAKVSPDSLVAACLLSSALTPMTGAAYYSPVAPASAGAVVRGSLGWGVSAPAVAGKRERMQHLQNDTGINVAGLLKGPIGQVRDFDLSLDRFPLDDELTAAAVNGDIRLTRLRDGVMASVTASGTVDLECARCLRSYQQPFDVEFSEEYRQTVDVRTGLDVHLEADQDEDTAQIDDNHILDIGDVLRQEIVVALPMRPDCGDQCPGPDLISEAPEADDAVVDDRLAALANLLDDGERTR